MTTLDTERLRLDLLKAEAKAARRKKFGQFFDSFIMPIWLGLLVGLAIFLLLFAIGSIGEATGAAEVCEGMGMYAKEIDGVWKCLVLP